MSGSIKIKHIGLFRLVNDHNDRSLGWCALKRPLRNKAEKREFEELSRHFRFFGLCSLKGWPKYTDAPVDRDYSQICEGWCHCFRDPDRYLPEGFPRALISNSDFTKPKTVLQHFKNSKLPKHKSKQRDFIIVVGHDRWSYECKGWDYAKEVIPLLSEAGHSGLVVGGPERPKELDGLENIDFTPYLHKDDFISHLHDSRFSVFCNRLDASPRVIAESLCMDVPVLVNADILGGWKYVNPQTGAEFTSAEDCVEKARLLLDSKELSPKSFFCDNYGPANAGRKLAEFMKQLDDRFLSHSSVRLHHATKLGEKTA